MPPTQNPGERMNNWLDFRNLVEQFAWAMLGVLIGYLFITKIINDAKDRYYWLALS